MAKNGRIMLLPKCAVRNSKNSKLIKKQETTRFLSSLGIKTPLDRIPLLEPLLL